MMPNRICVRIAAPLLLLLACASAGAQTTRSAAPAAAQGAFITLGTMGGPVGHPARSQPANALVLEDGVHLIDAGDGAAQQVVRAGYSLTQLRSVFLSHLHFDHSGGLSAIIGLRYQVNAPGPLAIYGPPGTRELVAGITASMQPAAQAGYGIPGAPRTPPEETVRVVELDEDSSVELPGARVTTAANSHYSFPPGSAEAERFRSLSFRFDLPERSIVYTGDTGPSAEVERLARNADLLVSEMIDLPATLAIVRRNNPTLTGAAEQNMVRHLSRHHLSPEQVGELAARANAGRVVITHLVPGVVSREDEERYRAEIGRHYRGPVAFADDLDRF